MRLALLILSLLPSAARADVEVRITVQLVQQVSPAVFGCGKKIFDTPRADSPRCEPQRSSRPTTAHIVLVRRGHRRTLARGRTISTRWIAIGPLDSIEIDVRDGARLVDQLVLTPHDLVHASERGIAGRYLRVRVERRPR